jgi:hypothetical protein
MMGFIAPKWGISDTCNALAQRQIVSRMAEKHAVIDDTA